MDGHDGSIVALDTRTGQILAMVSRPAFDPNVFAHRFSHDVWAALIADPQHPYSRKLFAALPAAQTRWRAWPQWLDAGYRPGWGRPPGASRLPRRCAGARS